MKGQDSLVLLGTDEVGCNIAPRWDINLRHLLNIKAVSLCHMPYSQWRVQNT